ncbi:MAG: 2Fe-2S iron-sulfur cluster-binding protein [Rhizomicrobium sp.]
MVKIAYIEADGAEHVVEVKPGLSIMEAAVKNNIPGILGECGGICACGTCRVYVDHPAWQERTGQRSDLEKSMIDFHEDQDPNVRLGCQIKVTKALDGMVVRMPKSQRPVNEAPVACVSIPAGRFPE